MRINGFLGTSLIEYPGLIAAVIYTSPCNFRCGFCHNSNLIEVNEEVLEVKDIMRQIEERKKIIDAVVITGGEPTLQPDLKNFMLKIKEAGLKVKLDTNGYTPETLADIIKNKAVDYIAMDIKTSLSKYAQGVKVKVVTEKINESINLIMTSGLAYEFRTTVMPGLVGEEEMKEIGKMIKGAKLYALQQFSNKNTFDKSLESVLPYTVKALKGLADIVRAQVEKVEIRNI